MKLPAVPSAVAGIGLGATDWLVENPIATVGGVDDEVTSMMVVGHNPTAHELALGLGLSPQDRKPVERAGFPTCSLAVFSFDVDHWHEAAQGAATLVALFTPPY